MTKRLMDSETGPLPLFGFSHLSFIHGFVRQTVETVFRLVTLPHPAKQGVNEKGAAKARSV